MQYCHSLTFVQSIIEILNQSAFIAFCMSNSRLLVCYLSEFNFQKHLCQRQAQNYKCNYFSISGIVQLHCQTVYFVLLYPLVLLAASLLYHLSLYNEHLCIMPGQYVEYMGVGITWFYKNL